MERASPEGEAACEQCGYALTGLIDGNAPGVCPECGARFDGPLAWRPRAWPGRVRLLLAMCGPVAGAVGMVLALSLFRATRNVLIWPLWLVWGGLIVYLAFVWPLTYAKATARACEPMNTRAARVRREWVAGVLINFGVIVPIAALVFWRML